MGSEGDRENSERIEQGRVANGYGHIREPHATSNTAASRSPRREGARAAFSEHTRDAAAREYAREQRLDWDSLDPGGTENAALGWWHAACRTKRRRESAAGRSAWSTP